MSHEENQSQFSTGGISQETADAISVYRKFGQGGFIPHTDEVPSGYVIAGSIGRGDGAQVYITRKYTPPEGSPNNFVSFSDRENTNRLGQRIPDIFGTVVATPDLIASSYRIFENSREVELSYMCIGRGQYEIDEIKEGDTAIQDVPGSSYKIYGPNNSPNGGTPRETYGVLNNNFLHTKKIEGVSDEDLPGINDEGFAPIIITLDKLGWISGYNLLSMPKNNAAKFKSYYSVGDSITISAAQGQCYIRRATAYFSSIFGTWTLFSTSPHLSLNLQGTYEIDSYGGSSNAPWLKLKQPELVNTDWQELKDLQSQMYAGPYFSLPPVKYIINDNQSQTGNSFNIFNEDQSNTNEIGPYILENADSFIANLYAPDGLYSINDVGIFTVSHTIRISTTPVDINDSPTGATQSTDVVISGSAGNRQAVGITHYSNLTFTGRMSITFQMLTAKSLPVDGSNATFNDTLVVKSLYAAKSIAPTHFGDVTTIWVKSSANLEDVEETGRKLNCRASRVIDVLQSNGSYVQGTTSNFADIARFVSVDEKIGNLSLNELDIANFYETYEAVIANFGTTLTGEFNYTFDDNDLTYEETLGFITQACFSTAFRNGVLIQFNFERLTTESVLLFNHRNKVIGGESRITNFGYTDNNDGIELEYRDNGDGSNLTFYEPLDQTAKNPLAIDVEGVTHRLQAYFHAKRLLKKLRYQNVTVEFEATGEAQLLGINDRIQVSDNTRVGTYDGEIENQNGLILTLSQPFVFEIGKQYSIFLQNIDKTVQKIAIAPGANLYEILLADASNSPLATDPALFAKTVYEIASNDSVNQQFFLVKEKRPTDNQTVIVTAINYDDRYYDSDGDFISGTVDVNGEVG